MENRLPEPLQVTAEQIMKRDFATLPSSAPISEAVHLLADKDTACAVVLDADGKPEGIITERDLLGYAEANDEARLAKVLKRMLVEEHHIFDSMKGLQAAKATTVGGIASKPVKCAEADMTLGKIASILETYDYRQIPVMKDGELVGLVGRQEIVKAIADRE
jgi:CBS domain-containing protein